jgi:putative aminomethyltransferase
VKLEDQLKDINKKNLFCKTEWITGKIIKIETLDKESSKKLVILENEGFQRMTIFEKMIDKYQKIVDSFRLGNTVKVKGIILKNDYGYYLKPHNFELIGE